MPVLTVEDLHVSYGNIRALKGVSLKVEQGQIVTLIGSNGAGKSTLMNTLSGLVRANSGRIVFEDKEITNLPSQQIVRSGIILSPEGRQVFPKMTVMENLMMGAYTIQSQEVKKKSLDDVMDFFPILRERSKQTAGTLSGGEQQMLALARALMSQPKLLMLDEPSLGLAPLIFQEILRRVVQINKEMGTTILMVEQNARKALSISDYSYVLETGLITLEGPSAEMASDERVRAAYLS